MYNVLVSTHCAQDWSARPDPITKLIEFRPFMAKGGLHTCACGSPSASHFKQIMEG